MAGSPQQLPSGLEGDDRVGDQLTETYCDYKIITGESNISLSNTLSLWGVSWRQGL